MKTIWIYLMFSLYGIFGREFFKMDGFNNCTLYESLLVHTLQIQCAEFNSYVYFDESRMKVYCHNSRQLTDLYATQDLAFLKMTNMFFLRNKTETLTDLELHDCPLPSKPFVELFFVYNMRNIKHLKFFQLNSNPKVVRWRDDKKVFSNLSNIIELQLRAPGLSEMSGDMFENMESLRSLQIRYTISDPNIPKEIFQSKPNLEEIVMIGNKFTHLDPSTLQNLHKLKKLHLYYNSDLDNISSSFFSGVPNLEELFLHENHLTSLSSGLFKGLRKLKKLCLSENTFTSLPYGLLQDTTALEEFELSRNRNPENLILPKACLSNLVNLTVVALSDNKIRIFNKDVLFGSTRIERIILKRNLLTHLDEKIFFELSKLIHLDLSENKLASLPENLFQQNGELRKLLLHHNRLKEVDQLLYITHGRLEFLDLSFNRITNISRDLCLRYGSKPNLVTLDISHNYLQSLATSDPNHKNYSVLNGCFSLKHLRLAHNNLTKIYFDWKSMLFNVNTIDLSHNRVASLEADDLIFHNLFDLSLDLSYNQITTIQMTKLNIDETETSLTFHKDLRSHPLHVVFDGNPFNCDCNLFSFVKFMHRQYTLSFPKTRFESQNRNTICSSPEDLYLKPLLEVDYKELKCKISNTTDYKCPEHCVCKYRTFDQSNIIDCRGGHLKVIPPALPRHPSADHTELDLRGGRLQEFRLPDDPGYKNITHLRLVDNDIALLELQGLSNLIKTLDISNNSLKSLSEDTILLLTSANELTTFEIYGNSWLCSCETKSLVQLFKTKKLLMTKPDLVQCSDGTPMEDIDESLLCAVNNSLLHVMISLLVVLFTMTALTALYYRHQDNVHVYCYSSRFKILQWLVTRPDRDQNKKYDVFISYAHQDEDFVVEHLMPFLEDREDFRYKVCLHFRDWMPGEMIASQIFQSVHDSRRTLVVLSPSFLESVWGVMEFKTAHSEALREGTSRVIVVLYQDVEDVPSDRWDDELRAYLQMNTYVKWGSPWFWKQLKYALPHAPEHGDDADVRCALSCCSRPATARASATNSRGLGECYRLERTQVRPPTRLNPGI